MKIVKIMLRQNLALYGNYKYVGDTVINAAEQAKSY